MGRSGAAMVRGRGFRPRMGEPPVSQQGSISQHTAATNFLHYLWPGPLERLPPSTTQPDPFTSFTDDLLGDLGDKLLEIPYLLVSKGGDAERIVLWQDHLAHLLRTDVLGNG